MIKLIFSFCFIISSFIFFLRNPDPFFNPVFFAEDGKSYVGPILSYGFWNALTQARSDYLVLGNVLLSGLAVFINKLFYGDNILHIPKFVAVVSYLFWGFVSTFPILLLHRLIPVFYLTILSLLVSFFPLGISDFEVIGRILNTGYAFVYIAFILILYRNKFAFNLGWKTIFVDLGILLCSLTNPIVCLTIPVIYVPYVKWLKNKKIKFQRLFQNKSFLSGIFLSTVLLIQTILVTTGSDNYAGDLDSPFILASVIEMLFARSILYPIIYPFYGHMNDVFTIILFAFLVWAFIKLSNPRNYELYLTAIYCLIVFSLAVLLFRPGLTALLNGYSTSWPDRYYYGQNLLSIFLIVLLIYDISSSIRNSLLRGTAILAFLVFLLHNIDEASTYGNPEYSLREIGTFDQSLTYALCSKSFVDSSQISTQDGDFVIVPIYPTIPPWTMVVPREMAEKSVKPHC